MSPGRAPRRSAPWRSIPPSRRPAAYLIGASESQHWYFDDGRGTISAGLTSHPPDDGFHEIQLNGKQLVFLFMAATVVSVVIFLCGVLVGRAVKAQLGGVAENSAASTIAETTPTQPPTPAPAPAAGSDPTTAAAPPPAAEDL